MKENMRKESKITEEKTMKNTMELNYKKATSFKEVSFSAWKQAGNPRFFVQAGRLGVGDACNMGSPFESFVTDERPENIASQFVLEVRESPNGEIVISMPGDTRRRILPQDCIWTWGGLKLNRRRQ